MEARFVAVLLFLFSLARGSAAAVCEDLDTNACILLRNVKPDLCQDASFDISCKKFCGHCGGSGGLQCYDCAAVVSDPNACKQIKTCSSPEACVLKSLTRPDGRSYHIMTCEDEKICSGAGFGFGSVGIGRRRRDISVKCCHDNLCNHPAYTPTPSGSPSVMPSTVYPIHSCRSDIIFVLDESSSTGQGSFIYAVDFITRIVHSLDIGYHGDQVGFLLFDSTPHLQWNLQDYPTKDALLSALTYVPYHNGTTRPDLALNYVNHNMLTFNHGDRNVANNVVIFITGGESRGAAAHQRTVAAARQLRARSSDVIAIGLASANHATNAEIADIATDSNHVIQVPYIDHLSDEILKVLNLICKIS